VTTSKLVWGPLEGLKNSQETAHKSTNNHTRRRQNDL